MIFTWRTVIMSFILGMILGAMDITLLSKPWLWLIYFVPIVSFSALIELCVIIHIQNKKNAEYKTPIEPNIVE